MTQPDSIVPDSYNPLDWNRYSYVRYNPLKYTDPTGHDPACGPDGIWCGYDGSGYAGGTGSGSTGGGGKNKEEGKGQWHQENIGGATPESVYHWQHLSSPNEVSDPFIDVLDEFIRIAKMLSPTAPPTLEVFLSYLTHESGDVVGMRITIVNGGASSATLVRIEMAEEALPSMTSCRITTNCIFKPSSPVVIDPGEIEIISICQNCLENRSTVYSHPFRPNKNNYIEVSMVLSMPINLGYQGVKKIPVPFIYTIPPR
ncbi:MAG: hypothetical protein KJZ77_11225 [Anaerolineales bacterium]|nr:hypothetical protein [Anaerolineales bacterium]